MCEFWRSPAEDLVWSPFVFRSSPWLEGNSLIYFPQMHVLLSSISVTHTYLKISLMRKNVSWIWERQNWLFCCIDSSCSCLSMKAELFGNSDWFSFSGKDMGNAKRVFLFFLYLQKAPWVVYVFILYSIVCLMTLMRSSLEIQYEVVWLLIFVYIYLQVHVVKSDCFPLFFPSNS